MLDESVQMRYSEQWLAHGNCSEGTLLFPEVAQMPYTVSVHFFLTIIVGNRFLYPHHAEEEIGSKIFSKLPKAE